MFADTVSLSSQDFKFPATIKAQNLYHQASSKNWFQDFWALWNKQPRTLIVLSSAQASEALKEETDLGTQLVPISQIKGSANAGRTHDFDINFRPLQAAGKERWLSVAMFQQQGRSMPPVQLIKVEDIYFVVDGHHRISVTKALGENVIEANVTVLSQG